MNETAVMKHEEQAVLSVQDVRQQINLIQSLMKDAMQKDEHYGIIPGCKKPSLLKPGAEKLSMMFRLSPSYEIRQTELVNGHRDYFVVCTLSHSPTARVLGQGVGSCSSMESKFRYRGGEKVSTGKPIPKEYWNLKNDGKTEDAQKLIGGRGFAPGKIDGNWEICGIGEKTENPDIADQYNTVLKMAKKRAHVDAVLTVTAASDIFTQDIEDLITPPVETMKPPVKMPTEKKQEPPAQDEGNETPPAENHDENAVISEKQGKRLFAIAHKANVSMEALREYLMEEFGVEHSKDITRGEMYETTCAWAEAGGQKQPE